MANATVEVLVDDLDGSPASETVRLGWNGDWRELDLSKRNHAVLARAMDKFWNAGRAVPEHKNARRRGTATPSRSKKPSRDPKIIRAWATEHGIAVPARGRIPAEVERQFNAANGRT